MSSFIRKTSATTGGSRNARNPASGGRHVQASENAPGTRPSPTGGPHLVSSGCADLDRVLGGGLSLGALTVFSEDGWTGHGELFLKYVVSEAVAAGQLVGVIRHADDEYTRANRFLLRRMSKAEAMREVAAEKAAMDATQNETKLRIAWQYEKYAKNTRAVSADGANASGSASVNRPALGKTFVTGARGAWCHDHDISKPASEDDDEASSLIEMYTVDRKAPVAQIVAAARAFAVGVSKRPGTVGRLVIPSLGGAVWNMEPEAVVNALVHVRSIVQERDPRVAVVASVPMDCMRASEATSVMHASDACFKLMAVEDTSSVVRLSSDARSVCGTMDVMRLPGFGWIRSSLPEVRSYVMRKKRKRLALEVFAVDPDAEARAGGEGGATGQSFDW